MHTGHYTVGEVAKLARVSVRTLHHYDRMGLLTPSDRSRAGYRLYTDDDLERLQHILFYRELGFGLTRIAELMAHAPHDRRAALEAQRELVLRQLDRHEAMLTLIDKTLAALEGGIRMTNDEMFAVFGDFDPAEHEDEAHQRWGHTEAYAESARRTKGYSKQDWQRFKEESDAVNAAVAALMDEGVPPDDPRALAAVERHRQLIDTWFYPCSPEMHAELGRMYVADARFPATYENVRAGMAQYLSEATAANAAHQQAAAGA